MESRKTRNVDTRFGPIVAFEDDLITEQVLKFGNHSRPEFAFATSVLQNRDQVFDLGAHIGTFSLVALEKIGPNGNLLAVEGSELTHSLLTQNLAAKAPAAQSLNTFIGDGGEFQYVMPTDNTGAGYLVPSEETMEMHSIDQLVEQHFQPSFIKIDLEGFEQQVITASDYIRRTTPTLYVEVHGLALERAGANARQLMQYLRSLGYGFFVNKGPRDAAHDVFRVTRKSIPERQFAGLFDVLCVHKQTQLYQELAKQASYWTHFRAPIRAVILGIKRRIRGNRKKRRAKLSN